MNPEVYYLIHKIMPLDSALRQMNSVHIHTHTICLQPICYHPPIYA
jgi:hypothetical protein